MYLGVKAVLAKSFERIHAANLVNFGILPLLFEDPADHGRLEPGMALTAPQWRQALEQGGGIQLQVPGQAPVAARVDLSARQRRILLAGGLLNHTTQN